MNEDGGREVREGLAEHLRALLEMGITELRVSRTPSTLARDAAREGLAVKGLRPGSAQPAILRPRHAARVPQPASSMSAAVFGEPVVVRAPLQEGLFAERSVVDPGADRAALLESLRSKEIGACVRCRLHEGRTSIVFGSGNPRAELMFVGEGPGADEDAQGLPFVGRAGRLLTKMIESMVVAGRPLRREEVYIANIVKCRPPGNRAPEPDEIASCEGFLFTQIAIIRPRLIVALGAFAARTLLRSKAPISALRGRFHEYRGTLLMPTFHPAYVLRNYTEETRRTVYEDLKKAATEIGRLRGNTAT